MPQSTKRRQYLKAVSGTTVGAATLLSGCLGGEGSDGTGTPTGTGGGTSITEWTAGGSQEGSPFNTWIQGMASEIEEHSDILRWSPQFVNGFRAGIVQLADGELDIASSWHHNAFQAQNDMAGFSEGGDIGPLEKDVKATLPVTHQGYWFYATYADRDDIETIRDLEGMTVGLNVPNAGVTIWALEQFEIMGISDSITFEFLSLGDVGNALQSRQVDAALQLAVNGSILTTSEARAWSSVDMKGIQIPKDVIEQHKEQNQLVSFDVVRNEDLNEKGKFEQVRSMLLSSGQFTTAEHDADLVYEAVKILMENQDALAEYHPAMNLWGIGEGKHGFQGVPKGIEYHEGAIRYYEENDIDFPGASQQ